MTPDASVATALALLAVDPALGGLVLIGVDGWALEPWAARLAALLGGPAGVLRLPATITPEHLLGGLDLPASLQQGRRVRRTGVLAAHDGGVLWIPDPDLLAPEIAGPLAAVLRRGRVHLERDGIGAHDPARLVLLATMTAPGPPRYPALLEPAGLWLAAPDPDPRLPAGLEPAIVAARARLPTVTIADTQIAALAATALRLGVEGVQADYLAARTARAAAALAEHARVEAADLELAIALVIAPRASGAAPAQTRQPAPPEQT
ncbi:MAG TPA: magnesium chelatase ATPase subunit D, partial [Chloroflexia bacterium]|nr:magnesium chelatase ATPase subunit D [Chloroflexia bacterium]